MTNREHTRATRIIATCRRMLVAAAASAALALPMTVVRTAQISLLEPVDASISSQMLNAPGEPAGKRSRLVRVNLAPLPTPGTNARLLEDDVDLELFPDVTVRAVFDRFETIGGSATWVGHVDGVPMSSVTLAYRNGYLTANINTRDGFFQIHPAPQQDTQTSDTRPLHVVSEVDPNALPHGPDTVEKPVEPRAGAFDAAPAPQRLTDAGDVIDLMVVYTPAAMARAGGPAGVANSIALQVADTNQAYANSNIKQRLRLVHTQLVSYAESSTTIFPSLNDLIGGVGGLSGVAALRDTHGADLVTLLVQSFANVNCGVAPISVAPGLGERYGYSVIADGGCASIYVMAHELGHNMGARHDWYVDAAQTPFSWGHGHVDMAGRWRTIMAYPDICNDQGFNCPTLNYFSTPDGEYVPFCSNRTFNCDLLRYWFFPGRPLGVREDRGTDCTISVVPSSPCSADNRRVLNDTALTVANYRQSR